MAWETRKRALVEHQPDMGGTHVVGWEHVRHCGCMGRSGMRMDKHELTYGLVPCDQHGGEVARVLDTLQHMPPQAEEMDSLVERLLEAEIGTGV